MSKRSEAPTQFRITLRHGISRVDRESRVIYGVSAIQKGEALGHDMYIDDQFLHDAAQMGQANEKGKKSRFTHPGMCSDGLGKNLGRMKNFRVEGDKVLGDLHFNESSKKTPDGDLSDYVMTLAEEDPESFGASIVFERDLKSEDNFKKNHSTEELGFKSPDESNEKNLYHARIANLMAVDAVDDPAANRDGLFSNGSDILNQADGLFDAIFSDDETSVFGGVHIKRIREYFNSYLDRANLGINNINLEKEDQSMEITLESLSKENPALLSKIKQEARSEGIKDERERSLNILKSSTSFGFADKADSLIGEDISHEQALSKLKDFKIESLEKSNSNHVEADGQEVAVSDKTPEEEFDSDPKIKQEFGSKEAYLAFKKAEAQGLIRKEGAK